MIVRYIAGNNSIRGDETVTFTDNMSFDGTERGGKMTTNGELWIGSTVAPHVRKGTLVAGTGITITPAAGSITITNSSPSLGGDVVGPASSTDNALVRWDGTTGKLIQNSVTIEDDTGNISQTAAVSGATLSYTLANTSNTASAQENQVISVGGGTASDAFTTYTVTGVTSWSAGIDNSSGGDPYKLSASTALGTTDVFSVSTGGSYLLTGYASGTSNSLVYDNANNIASTDVYFQAKVAGSTAGDPYFRSQVSGVSDWSWGIDNSDSDAFVIAASGTLGSTNVMRASTAGEINYPLQPAFSAYFASAPANVTGNGTTYIFGDTDVGGGVSMTEIFDQGGDFSTGSSSGALLTAPVDGKWIFTMSCLLLQASTATSMDFTLRTSNFSYRGYQVDPSAVDVGGNVQFGQSFIAIMDAGDTADCRVSASGVGADTVDIYGAASDPRSTFSGWQLG